MKTIRLLPLAVAAALPLAACGSRDDAVANNGADVVLDEEGVRDANVADPAANSLDPGDAALANDAALNSVAPANGY